MYFVYVFDKDLENRYVYVNYTMKNIRFYFYIAVSCYFLLKPPIVLNETFALNEFFFSFLNEKLSLP